MRCSEGGKNISIVCIDVRRRVEKGYSRHINDDDQIEQLQGDFEQRPLEERHRLLPQRAEERRTWH